MKDLSLHILDILENSIRANAKNIEIKIIEDLKKDKLTLTISDDGIGMNKKMLKKSIDPFVTTKNNKKVGLGLSLLKQAAESANGKLEINSEPGKLTNVKAEFQLSHIDRKPTGNISDTLLTMIICNPDINFKYVHRRDNEIFEFDTQEFNKKIKKLSINQTNKLKILKEKLNKNLID